MWSRFFVLNPKYICIRSSWSEKIRSTYLIPDVWGTLVRWILDFSGSAASETLGGSKTSLDNQDISFDQNKSGTSDSISSCKLIFKPQKSARVFALIILRDYMLDFGNRFLAAEYWPSLFVWNLKKCETQIWLNPGSSSTQAHLEKSVFFENRKSL